MLGAMLTARFERLSTKGIRIGDKESVRPCGEDRRLSRHEGL
jgi:hypothetical protein